MRILFIVHRVPFPPNKGEKLRSCWQLRTLAKDHDVDLFCFYDDPEDEKYFDQLRHYCEAYYVEKLSYVGSRARAILALLRGRSFSTAFFYSSQMKHRIQSALESGSYDRIFVSSSSMARYVEANDQVIKVLDLVDVDSNKWQQYADRSPWPMSWLWRREAQRLGAYESLLVKKFSATLVCTDAEAELLRSVAAQGGIRVVQNYIDVEQYDPANVTVSDEIRSLRPYLVFSGSMDYLPNIDAVGYFCREIFPLIQQARPDVRLVIAGRNPHASVREFGTNPLIKVTGSVPDMKPYLSAAAVAIAPMRIARGVQNKVLEALASGVPAVTTAAVALALPATVRCMVGVGDTPQDFAARVIAALRDRSDRQSSQLRVQLKRYVDGLGLSTQLEEAVRNPNLGPIATGARENEIAGFPA